MSVDRSRRVNIDDVEFDDQLALVNDVPFTGLVFVMCTNGQLEAEYNYVEGLPSGIQRTWYPDGNLMEEWSAIRGRGSAWTREWYQEGTMKSERIYENGALVRVREWGEDGQLLSDAIK